MRNILLLLCFASVLFGSCYEPKEGCLDIEAVNFDASAGWETQSRQQIQQCRLATTRWTENRPRLAAGDFKGEFREERREAGVGEIDRADVDHHCYVILSEAKNLHDDLRDPSLSLRVTWYRERILETEPVIG